MYQNHITVTFLRQQVLQNCPLSQQLIENHSSIKNYKFRVNCLGICRWQPIDFTTAMSVQLSLGIGKVSNTAVAT